MAVVGLAVDISVVGFAAVVGLNDGFAVVGLNVGERVVGFAVVGLDEVGCEVDGLNVGMRVVGLAVVGLDVVGFGEMVPSTFFEEGLADGALDDGFDVGLSDVGIDVGLADVGLDVGICDGVDVGLDVGVCDGVDVGVCDGLDVGLEVDVRVDGVAVVGLRVAGFFDVGLAVGLGVGHPLVYRTGPNLHLPLEHVSSPEYKSELSKRGERRRKTNKLDGMKIKWMHS